MIPYLLLNPLKILKSFRTHDQAEKKLFFSASFCYSRKKFSEFMALYTNIPINYL